MKKLKNKNTEKNAIIVLSGGMDSGVLLADYRNKMNLKAALFFDYGSKHNAQELKCAKILAKIYNVKFFKIDLPFINNFFNSALLSSSNMEIPEASYGQENMKSTVVPFRNGIMLAIATGFAESLDAEFVLLGSHSGDHSLYPDCTSKFNKAFAAAAKAGTYNQAKIFMPYSKISKRGIAEIGRKIEFPFEKSWSCYKGEKIHCGKCATCIERNEALTADDKIDPTIYQK